MARPRPSPKSWYAAPYFSLLQMMRCRPTSICMRHSKSSAHSRNGQPVDSSASHTHSQPRADRPPTTACPTVPAATRNEGAPLDGGTGRDSPADWPDPNLKGMSVFAIVGAGHGLHDELTNIHTQGGPFRTTVTA